MVEPWVLAFEIFIPLVLFFILLGLRQKKPAIPVKEAPQLHRRRQRSVELSIRRGNGLDNVQPMLLQETGFVQTKESLNSRSQKSCSVNPRHILVND
ncbi:unnamed protein product [Arctogadus glacialis]